MEKYIQRSDSCSSLNSKRPADDNADDWRTPKRTALAKNAKFDGTRDIPTHNNFQNLAVDGEGKTLGNELYYKAATKVKKTSHIPPIILDVKTDWTHDDIKGKIAPYSNRYHLQYRSGGKVAVICHTSDAHQAVKDGLRVQNASFVTYTRKDEKIPKIVLRGLPAYVEEELPKELNILGFAGATVKLLKSRNGVDNPCPPFLVQLTAGADIMKFRQIKYLCNCVVTITKFKPNRSHGTQCFRCQDFGHASKNCNKPPRCVKCAEPHATTLCPKTDRTEPAHCCNCKEAHPANYRKCSARIAYVESIEKKKLSERKYIPSAILPTLKPPTVDATPAFNYGSWPSLRPSNMALKNQTPIDPLPNEPNDEATKEMFEILLVLKNIKSQFAACTSWLDKVMLVLSHLGKYV